MTIQKSREYFLDQQQSGMSLSRNESDVTRIPDREYPHRAWVGFDLDQNAVAYFESNAGADLKFAVSVVISVQSTKVELEDSEESVECIKVICQDTRLNEVFYAFVDELLDRLVNDGDSADIIQQAAGEWRRLLQLAGTEIGRSTAVGLFGELRFLESSIKEIGPSALETWQRNDFDIHDFISPHAHVEVKTSSLRERSAVTINGLKQLSVPVNSTLTLAVAEIDEHGSEHLDDVIDRILSLGVDRQMLVDKLASIGYVIGMPEASAYSFDLVSWRFWEIDSDSPVLSTTTLSSEVTTSISSVRYSLQLAALGSAESTFDYRRFSDEAGQP